MELRDYIEEAARKAGSVSALARLIEMSQPDLSNAKAMKKRLPQIAVFKIAEYIDADPSEVTAANELVTEKDEKKRAYWTRYANQARAAGIALAIAVTFFATPDQAQASNGANSAESSKNAICIM